MVNAGAIATADLIKGSDYPDRVTRMLGMLNRYTGQDVYVDNSVFMSERTTGHRNRAMVHLRWTHPADRRASDELPNRDSWRILRPS